MSNPKIRFLCAWTRQVIELRDGHTGLSMSPILCNWPTCDSWRANRRDWLMNQEILAVLRAQPRTFAGSTIVEAETALANFANSLCARHF